MTSKECTKCSVTKDLTEFYKRNEYENSYTSHCRECVQARHRGRQVEPVQEGTKVCTRCDTEKPVSEFGPMVTAADGRKPHCKQCHAGIQLEYVDVNREEVNARYRANNAKHTARNRKRRVEDPAFRIRCNLSGRVSSALKTAGTRKSENTKELVGCSIEDLKAHLESKFTEGMTWENYGEWHMDHIKPCVTFNLVEVEEQRKCFNWTNLQPLWALDNIRKSSRWEGSTRRIRTRLSNSPADPPN
jgi:hypothetical protein